MNLEERIKKGMIFYETEHKSIENKEIEERLDKERDIVKRRCLTTIIVDQMIDQRLSHMRFPFVRLIFRKLLKN